jgi:UDP-N-acetylmuramate dehydrogenase
MEMMAKTDLRSIDLPALETAFGSRLQKHVLLARYSAARLGGPADALLEARSSQELVQITSLCWQNRIPFFILGGGSNVLISEAGVRGLVVLNKARQVRFDEQASPPTVWAESGMNFGVLARQAAQRGLTGLEWAAGIPGTVGGAVVGNAGAHGGDMAGNLLLAEILHRTKTNHGEAYQQQTWTPERLEFTYRNSFLKRQPDDAIVLAALLRLEHSSVEEVQKRLDEYIAHRRRTQPPGASMGSMFKNPTGDYAGRLIEAAGLKGYRIGDAQISPLHANFFINLGQASSQDVFDLIQLARQIVSEKFSVNLELEVELVGEWQ